VLENQLWSYRCAAQCIVEAVEAVGQIVPGSYPDISAKSAYFRAPTREQRDCAVGNGTRLL